VKPSTLRYPGIISIKGGFTLDSLVDNFNKNLSSIGITVERECNGTEIKSECNAALMNWIKAKFQPTVGLLNG
jgi:hypothetical protein